MSEKQFVLYEHKENYYILKNPRIHLDFIEMLGDALTSEEIVEELNQLNDKVVELAEENEQLRQSIEDYKDHNSELEFEIKQCRTKNKELQDKIDKIIEELDQYRYNETLYAKEIVKLNNEVKEVLKFKTLGGDY